MSAQAQKRLYAELEPGMRVTIQWVARRYGLSYRAAQRAMRHLWRVRMLSP